MNIITLFSGLFLLTINSVCSQNFSVRNLNMCDIYGGIFVTNDPSKAQIHVYVEESEAFCDLPVFSSPSILYADRSGLWYFTENLAQAKYIVYFQKKRNLANFSIAIIESESFAGCK
ncbi:MAG: DUF6150 family protein [Cytophagales bacterium]